MPFSSQPVVDLAMHGITNQEHVVELVRRVQKSRLLLHALGGLVPGLDPHHFQGRRQVLDIGCGPGIWTGELAHIAPSTQVIGIETSQTMINSALHRASEQRLTNAHYQVVSSLVGPLAFADGTLPDEHAPAKGGLAASPCGVLAAPATRREDARDRR